MNYVSVKASCTLFACKFSQENALWDEKNIVIRDL